MRPTSNWLLMLSLLCAGAWATPAGAQDSTLDPATAAEGEPSVEAPVITEEPDVLGRDALAHNAELLDQLLERSTLIEDDPQSQYSRGLGVMFMTLGMADLTLGVFAATRIPHERHRLDRWQRARKDGITDIELAHFEGELQAAQETREGERLLVRWGGLTHALAGVMVLAFSPIPDSMSGSDRVSGYVIGGVFFAVGIATFAASFRDTPSEKAWKDYNARKTPMPGHEFHWGLAPTFSKQGAGVAFGGAF
jgi:hypothetical protein